MNNIVLKHYRNYFKATGKGIPKYFNPYNECEIKEIAPALTCNCGHWDASSTILICEDNKKE